MCARSYVVAGCRRRAWHVWCERAGGGSRRADDAFAVTLRRAAPPPPPPGPPGAPAAWDDALVRSAAARVTAAALRAVLARERDGDTAPAAAADEADGGASASDWEEGCSSADEDADATPAAFAAALATLPGDAYAELGDAACEAAGAAEAAEYVLPRCGALRLSGSCARLLLHPAGGTRLDAALRYSFAAAAGDDGARRLLLLQVATALTHLHAASRPHGALCAAAVTLTEPRAAALAPAEALPPPPSAAAVPLPLRYTDAASAHRPRPPPFRSLRALCSDWLAGTCSTFEYLLALNAAAGRRCGDRSFHAVFPWVLDFTAPPENIATSGAMAAAQAAAAAEAAASMGPAGPSAPIAASLLPVGWRDLSRTKWRLTKGDEQLDVTYARSEPAHHIPHDALSELAVCIYTARRQPEALLRRVVRAVFEPNEYPASMPRLYAWTPDEAIPEFYCDAAVFASRHPRMADLAPPAWAADAADFVARHRAALESPMVGARLHAWIDLTFGAALAGPSAVAAKNVALPAAAGELRRGGRAQLFSGPHPRRERDLEALRAAAAALEAEEEANTPRMSLARPPSAPLPDEEPPAAQQPPPPPQPLALLQPLGAPWPPWRGELDARSVARAIRNAVAPSARLGGARAVAAAAAGGSAAAGSLTPAGGTPRVGHGNPFSDAFSPFLTGHELIPLRAAPPGAFVAALEALEAAAGDLGRETTTAAANVLGALHIRVPDGGGGSPRRMRRTGSFVASEPPSPAVLPAAEAAAAPSLPLPPASPPRASRRARFADAYEADLEAFARLMLALYAPADTWPLLGPGAGAAAEAPARLLALLPCLPHDMRPTAAALLAPGARAGRPPAAAVAANDDLFPPGVRAAAAVLAPLTAACRGAARLHAAAAGERSAPGALAAMPPGGASLVLPVLLDAVADTVAHAAAGTASDADAAELAADAALVYAAAAAAAGRGGAALALLLPPMRAALGAAAAGGGGAVGAALAAALCGEAPQAALARACGHALYRRETVPLLLAAAAGAPDGHRGAAAAAAAALARFAAAAPLPVALRCVARPLLDAALASSAGAATPLPSPAAPAASPSCGAVEAYAAVAAAIGPAAAAGHLLPAVLALLRPIAQTGDAAAQPAASASGTAAEAAAAGDATRAASAAGAASSSAPRGRAALQAAALAAIALQNALDAASAPQAVRRPDAAASRGLRALGVASALVAALPSGTVAEAFLLDAAASPLLRVLLAPAASRAARCGAAGALAAALRAAGRDAAEGAALPALRPLLDAAAAPRAASSAGAGSLAGAQPALAPASAGSAGGSHAAPRGAELPHDVELLLLLYPPLAEVLGTSALRAALPCAAAAERKLADWGVWLPPRSGAPQPQATQTQPARAPRRVASAVATTPQRTLSGRDREAAAALEGAPRLRPEGALDSLA